MAKLKGNDLLKEIDKIVNKFVKPFGVTAYLDSDFLYIHDSKEVHYSFAVTDRNLESWGRWLKSLAPEMTADVFITSLLHEVGHHMTMDSIDPVVQAHCDDIKRRLMEVDETCQLTQGELDFIYYTLPDELAATEWAVNYIRCAPERCAKFWEKVQPIIVKFYEANGIKVDEVPKAEKELEYEEVMGVEKPKKEKKKKKERTADCKRGKIVKR